MRSRLFTAAALSLAIVLGSPYIGQLTLIVQSALPRQYRFILAAVVGTAIVLALVFAVVRIRDRRFVRYASLAAALSGGAVYARLTSTGNIDVDLAELFHFVEYGLLACLFYRVWQWHDDIRMFVLPLCATTVVGIADESLQWLVPTRVGELRDVTINAVAGVCGLLFSIAVDPPRAIVRSIEWRTRRLLGASVAAVALTGAAFVDVVHLGHDVHVEEISFRSHFRAETLKAIAAERAERWRKQPPIVVPGIAVEDRYLSEGRWHVQQRNEAFGDGDTWTAWNENLILETFFAPLLDLGHRWSAEQRAQAAAAAAGDPRPFISEAHPYPIFAVDRWRFWLMALTVVAAAWLLFLRRVPAVVHEASV